MLCPLVRALRSWPCLHWDSPAFNAGLGDGPTIIAVNDLAYDKGSAKLDDASTAAKGGKMPIKLLVKEFNRHRAVNLDDHDGLRYPHLQHIVGTPDRLSKIFEARRETFRRRHRHRGRGSTPEATGLLWKCTLTRVSDGPGFRTRHQPTAQRAISTAVLMLGCQT